MDNWNKKKLGDIAFEVRKTFEPNGNNSVPYVGLKHISKGDLHLIGSGDSSDTKSKKRKFKKGDILFGSLRPYFRKVARPSFNGVCSTDITVIRSKDGTNQSFLNYLIASQDFIDHSDKISSGSRMPRANWKVLEESEWKIPDIKTQQKIASILSAFDDLIENNTRRIEILEEMARRIYREWFVYFRYPDHEKDELVDSGTDLGEIPEGWEVKKLKDSLKFKNGKSPQTKEGKEYPVYGSNGIIGKCNEPGWEDGVIIGRVGAYCGSVEYCEGKFWGSDNTIVATTGEEYDFPLFAYYKLEDLNLRRYAGGSAQPLMTQKVIKDIKVAIPSNELLEQFCKQARDLWKLKRNLEKQNKKLKETRDLLLPKLISGEVEVDELKLNK